METRYTLSLRSNDAVHIATHKAEWLKNTVVLTAVQRKLARLENLARRQRVYTCSILLAVDELIDNVQSSFLQDIATYQNQLSKTGLTADKLSAPTRFKREYGFSNRLFFGMLQTLEYFDTLICLLIAAKQAGLFEHRSTVFVLLDKAKKIMHTFLSALLQIRLSEVPDATLSDYLDNTARYQKSAKVLGDINPRHAIAAIQKDLLPGLSSERTNRYLAKLEERAALLP